MKNTFRQHQEGQQQAEIQTMDILLSSEKRAEFVYNEARNAAGKYRYLITKHGRVVRIPKGIPVPV